MSRSAYTAHIDIDKCVACGKCVEYCPSGAVKLGQKLNTKMVLSNIQSMNYQIICLGVKINGMKTIEIKTV